MLDLVGRHPPVQRVGHRQLDVLDAAARGELDHLLEDQLADVGALHRRQRQRDVVDRDRELHPRLQELAQRLAVERVVERVADRLADALDPGQRVGRVDHPRPERELLQPEPLALVDEERRRPLVDVQHEPRSGHVALPVQSVLGSNATRRVPSRPAPSAWSIASRQRRSGYVAPTTPSTGFARASSIARSNAWRGSPFALLDAARVGAGELELAEPQGREVDAGHRDPGDHHPPARPHRPQRQVERGARADAVDRDVRAAEQVGRAALGPELHRVGAAADAVRRLLRLDDLGRAEGAGPLALRAVLGDDGDPPGGGQLLQREERQHADRAGADHQHARVRRRRSPASPCGSRTTSGSTSTALRSGSSSGTGCSCERWATSIRLQPPPVSAQ